MTYHRNNVGDRASPELLTVTEIAEHLRVPVHTVYYWVGRREIPFLRVGKHLRFVHAQVVDHFQRRTDERKPCDEIASLLERSAPRRSLKSKARSLAPEKE